MTSPVGGDRGFCFQSAGGKPPCGSFYFLFESVLRALEGPESIGIRQNPTFDAGDRPNCGFKPHQVVAMVASESMRAMTSSGRLWLQGR